MSGASDGGCYVEKDESWDADGWTSVPNRAIRDTTLSWEAKGALAWLASHRETYRVTADDLAADGAKGREHARKMVRELEAKGWLTRRRIIGEGNRILRHEWRIYPRPIPPEQRTTPVEDHPTKGIKRPEVRPPSVARRDPVPPGTGISVTGPDQQEQQGASDGADGANADRFPSSEPETGFLGTGGPVTGAPVTGTPVPLEKTKKKTREIPPPPSRSPAGAAHDRQGPPAPGKPGEQFSLTEGDPPGLAGCPEHGESCHRRACGRAPRQVAASARVASRVVAHEDAVAAQLARREAGVEARRRASTAGGEARRLALERAQPPTRRRSPMTS